MYIDKVKPYETAEQIQALRENRRVQTELLDDLAQLRTDLTELLTSDIEDKSAAADIERQQTEKLEALHLAIKEESRIQGEREQLYIDHFNGDIEAILDDVREIVDAVEKEEYLEWQRRRTANLQAALSNLSDPNDKDARKKYKKIKQMATRGYQNCYFFILALIRVQLNAFSYYGNKEGERRAIEIVETKTSAFYSKPKGAKLERKPAEEVIRQYEPDITSSSELLQMGFGPVSDLMWIALNGDIDSLPGRRNKFNRTTTITVDTEDDDRIITSKSQNHDVTLRIPDLMKLTNGYPMAKKILVKTLVHANEWDDVVQFPLHELVGEEMYGNIDTARKGFNQIGRKILTSFKVSGEVTKGKKKALQEGDTTVVFIKTNVKNSVCKVYLNPYINRDFIMPYRASIPPWFFNLPNRAADLLLLIFTTARQRTREIAEKGCFSISYRSIQYHLNLPNEAKTKNPKRDIKDEIEKAITQIEEKNREHSRPLQAGEDPDFSLYQQEDYDASIGEYLETGKLLVYMKGEYAQKAFSMNKSTVDRIEKNRNRQEKIEDEAQIRARTQQLKNTKK